MKNRNFLLAGIALFTFFIFSACSPARKAEREAQREALVTELGKNALRNMVKEREENIKKYNVKCDYTKRPGEIIITKTEMAKYDKVRVFYDFKADTPAVNEADYKAGSTNSVLLVNGGLPAKDWCERNGVKQGARFPATRLEIIKGYKTEYCFPLEFDIPLRKQQ